MTDYQTAARKRQIRRYCLALAILRGLYVALVGLSLGAIAAAVLIVLTRR